MVGIVWVVMGSVGGGGECVGCGGECRGDGVCVESWWEV